MVDRLPGLEDQFTFFAHRGARWHAPENTLAAFRAAFELGASWIEADVYAVDGGLVVFHDDRLERTTNGSGFIREKGLTYLRSLDAGGGQRIPLLEEVLDLLGTDRGINIELKGPGTAAPLVALLEGYLSTRALDASQILVSSFNHHELKRFRELAPQLRCGALMAGLPLGQARFASELGAFSVHMSRDFIDAPFVDDAHARGLRVYIYTIYDRADLDYMRRLGVDGVFTDVPELGLP